MKLFKVRTGRKTNWYFYDSTAEKICLVEIGKVGQIGEKRIASSQAGLYNVVVNAEEPAKEKVLSNSEKEVSHEQNV